MKTLTLIFFVILSIPTFSQGYREYESEPVKEKFDIDRIDDMTGAIEKRTEWYTLHWVKERFSVRFSKVNNTYFLEFDLWSKAIRSFDDGEILIFKLEDGTLINLKNEKFTISHKEHSHMFFLTDLQNIIALSSSNITKFRIISTDGYIEHEINKARSNKIKAAAHLMLTEGYGYKPE